MCIKDFITMFKMQQFSTTLKHLTKVNFLKVTFRSYCNRNMLKLSERGMYEDIFPSSEKQEVIDLLNAESQCVYAGFDPTAKSLHVGNLLVLMNLLHWQRAGHQAIALIGGATGRIGDPSGRSKDREELSASVAAQNTNGIKSIITRIFENHRNIFWENKAPSEQLKPLLIVDNLNWYLDLNALDFVSKVGRNFRMGSMLSRLSVSSRLKSEHGMSFTEFTYQIFQAYDWFQLLKNHNCRFQVGGSDQMGNIVSGYELITRNSKKSVYGFTIPLVKTDSGDKYGKSAGNAVWLDPELTSPFELYQFFLRTKDADVERFLKLFTFNSVASIQDLCHKHQTKPELRTAQKKLATDMTLLIHGEEGLKSALTTTDAMYDSSLDKIAMLNATDLMSIFKGATLVDLLLRPGISVLQMVMEAECFKKENDALRIIAAGGLYINHQRAMNPEEILVKSVHILPNNVSLVRVGKKNYWIIKWMT
uniref:Tyrosine--tRNA ligase n=1 Tax=Clastoptera arizonana TaxID=38151 RepID=A0A1B6C6N0_9HEMI